MRCSCAGVNRGGGGAAGPAGVAGAGLGLREGPAGRDGPAPPASLAARCGDRDGEEEGEEGGEGEGEGAITGRFPFFLAEAGVEGAGRFLRCFLPGRCVFF